MPGDSGVLVVTRVRSTNTKCTRDRGCSGHPAFPTPSTGREIHAQLGRIAPRDRECAFAIGAVIARSEATKQSVLSFRGEMDCFASLAMTATTELSGLFENCIGNWYAAAPKTIAV